MGKKYGAGRLKVRTKHYSDSGENDRSMVTENEQNSVPFALRDSHGTADNNIVVEGVATQCCWL